MVRYDVKIFNMTSNVKTTTRNSLGDEIPERDIGMIYTLSAYSDSFEL